MGDGLISTGTRVLCAHSNRYSPHHKMENDGMKVKRLLRRIPEGKVKFSVSTKLWRVLWDDVSTNNCKAKN